jgi:predicted N-acetyltransferase YhbS
MTGRSLSRDEIPKVWTIDRSEVIDAVYYLEDGALVLKPEHYDMRAWPAGEAAKYTPVLEACYDAGGWFHGLFEGGRLVGVAVLENRFIGRRRDTLQLKFLHVSSGCRGRGLGKRLFHLAEDEARRRGAALMYVSATPSERTIGFYLGLGCRVTQEPDPELFALEPGDIHLEYDLTRDRPGVQARERVE